MWIVELGVFLCFECGWSFRVAIRKVELTVMVPATNEGVWRDETIA